MEYQVTETPSVSDDQQVIDKVREHLSQFVERDVRPLSVYLRNGDGKMVGGLTAKTYWNWLHVEFLWVDAAMRETGLGTKILSLAEEEAVNRGCNAVMLDTFSFQARGFYEKLGYRVFGQLEGYSGKHQRFYMSKPLE